jgi:hypothetical protein
MTQEFVTTKGKAVVEREVLYLKNLSWQFHHSLLYELFVPLFWFFIAALKFIDAADPFEYFMAGVITVLAFCHGYPLYDVLFRRSLVSRIPLGRIFSFELETAPSGLETYVILRLKSGRYKKIAFRTREHEYEAFTALLSQYTHQPQPA